MSRAALWLKIWSKIPPAVYRPAQVSRGRETFLLPTCCIAVLPREYQVIPSLTRLKIYGAVNNKSLHHPSDTKGAGNQNPGRSKFHLLQPRPAGPETARTAGRSGRAGALATPALSPAFFDTGPAPSSKPAPSPICLEPLIGIATLPSPQSGHIAAHRGKQRGYCRCRLFLCIAC